MDGGKLGCWVFTLTVALLVQTAVSQTGMTTEASNTTRSSSGGGGGQSGGQGGSCVGGSDTADWGAWLEWRSGEILFANNYTNASRPGDPNDRWIDVSVGVRLSNIGSLSESSMQYEMSIDLFLSWFDDRLAGLSSYMTPVPGRHLWNPIYAMGEKVDPLCSDESCLMESDDQISTWLCPDGNVHHIAKQDVKITCAMNLRFYPLDKQECTFEIHGYDSMRFLLDPSFQWVVPGVPVVTDAESIHSQFEVTQVDFNAKYNSFLSSVAQCSYHKGSYAYYTEGCSKKCENYGGTKLSETKDDCVDTNKQSPNTYTTLAITMYMKRRLSYYMMEIYVPSITIVCLSWVAFWINRAAVPARVALGITTVLTMITQSTRVVDMPQISYVRAIDAWLLACQCMVFGALLEYAIVNYYDRKPRAKTAAAPPQPVKVVRLPNTPSEKGSMNGHMVPPEPPKKPKNPDDEGIAAMIDKGARILFPLSYLGFNIFYWVYYSVAEQHH
ncbi:glycine receptor subunit alpha-2-like [Branchiostoma lanceolatum]|uniref:glycine receptor subunit alpha-2-like n=1 Tax=Branchiostoma lanceolatum TaxID=7740 RepID=UPI003456EC7A